jgi:hypothetical protein
MEKITRASVTTFWAALLVVVPSACTIETVTTPGGSAGDGGASADAATDGDNEGGADTGAGGSDGGADAVGNGADSNGDGTTGDGSAAGPPAPIDSCDGPEITPNDDRDHATPYPLGAAAKGCLQSGTDVDFYQFTLPTAPAQGGFVDIKLTGVGVDGALSLTAYAVHDNNEIEMDGAETLGGSVFIHFAGKAGASFRTKVERYTDATRTPYTLTATFHPVNDENEPNDDNTRATPIMVGQPVSGYFFAGHEAGDDPPESAWEDRFKVTLTAGDVTIALTNVAPDMDGYVELFSPLGVSIDFGIESTPGASVVVKTTLEAEEAGTCFIVVNPYGAHFSHGTGSNLPKFWTQPYTLLVTKP